MSSAKLPGLILRDHDVLVPLDHGDPDGAELRLFAREVVASEKEHDELPWLLFLQGGPGFAAPRPLARTGWIGRAVKDFRVLLLDQRGTGRSSAVSHQSLARFASPQAQAAYLRSFRADAIVADAEWIRRHLLSAGERWTVLGQSYGGFCAAHYLCAAPEGLAGVLFTGGLPPLGLHCDEIYRRTYPLVAERNRRYYERYPGDAERARRIVRVLESTEVRLPTGDRLTPRRLQLLGLNLGMSDGAEALHYLLEDAFVAGREDEELSYNFLRGVENATHFDTNPIYSLLQEACYAQAHATRWSAERIRAEHPELDPQAEPFPFTGEMIFPWMFEEYAVLRPLRAAAEVLAAHEGWPALYDEAALRENRVPCAAAVYYDDMYVVRELSEATARTIRGLSAWYTNEHEHNGLRASGDKILDRLLEMLR